MDLQHLNVPAQLDTLLEQILHNQAVSTKFRLDIGDLTTMQRSIIIGRLNRVKRMIERGMTS